MTRQNNKQQTEAYFGLGHAHKIKRNVQLLVEYYKEALEISKDWKDKTGNWSLFWLGRWLQIKW